MGNITTISIRIDSDLKKQMENLCRELGMSMATAYTIFTKKCISENGIPFRVSSDPFYSESNIEFLKEGIKALNAGKGVAHRGILGHIAFFVHGLREKLHSRVSLSSEDFCQRKGRGYKTCQGCGTNVPGTGILQ